MQYYGFYFIWVDATYRVMDFSPALAGFDKRLHKKMSLIELLPERGRAAFFVLMEKIGTEEVAQIKYTHVDPAGRAVYLKLFCRKVPVLGKKYIIEFLLQNMAHEIQPDEQNENYILKNKLRESEKKYRTVIETQTELIIRFLPDGMITFMNNAFVQFFGLQDKGQPYNLKRFITDGTIAELTDLETYMPPNLLIRYIQTHVVIPDGRVRIVEWINRAIVNDAGVIIEFQASGRDITSKMELQNRLEQSRKENEINEKMLLRAERLSSLGTLSSAIAHEIRQPLNAIRILADAPLFWKSENNMLREDELLDAFSKISSNVDRIDRIMQTMSKMIKTRDSIELTAIDINKTIESVMLLVKQKMLNHNITPLLNLDPAIQSVNLSEIELQQVIVNIITNAINALDLSEKKEKRIEIVTMDYEDFVEISIADNGPGVPDPMKEKIFNPFFTTNAQTDGMGLGLYIVNMIVKSFDGTIELSNAVNGGTCFIIRFYRRR